MKEYKAFLRRLVRVMVGAGISSALLAGVTELSTWTPSTTEHQAVLLVVTGLLVATNKYFRAKGVKLLGL